MQRHDFHRRSFVQLALLLLTAGSWAADAWTKTKVDNFAAGKVAFAHANYAIAKERFALAAQASPRSVTAQYYLALSAAYCKDNKTAQQAMTRVMVMSTPGDNGYTNALQFFKNMNTQLGMLTPYTGSDNGELIRWDTKIMPIRIYVTRGLELPQGYSGDDLSTEKYLQMQGYLKQAAFFRRLGVCPYYDPEWYSAAIAGLNQWSWAMNENVLKYVIIPEPQNADIIVFWCPQMSGSSGKCYYASNSSKVVIQLCTKMDESFPKWVKPTLIENTAAHEFGHAWGLRSHSPNSNDCMSAAHESIEIHYNGIGRIQTGLTANDCAVLRALYQLPPNYYLRRDSSPQTTRSRKSKPTHR